MQEIIPLNKKILDRINVLVDELEYMHEIVALEKTDPEKIHIQIDSLPCRREDIPLVILKPKFMVMVAEARINDIKSELKSLGYEEE